MKRKCVFPPKEFSMFNVRFASGSVKEEKGKWKKLNINLFSRPWQIFSLLHTFSCTTFKINENVWDVCSSISDPKYTVVYETHPRFNYFRAKENQNNSGVVIFIARQINFQIKFQRISNFDPKIRKASPWKGGIVNILCNMWILRVCQFKTFFKNPFWNFSVSFSIMFRF